MSTIRVATFNVHRRLGRWQLRREVLLSALLDVNPDLVALQGFRLWRVRDNGYANKLNLRLSGQSHAPYKLVQRSGRHPLWGFGRGVGVLTNCPSFRPMLKC